MAMAINQEELQIIGEYVQSHLTERMIRVDEELKNQRELMKQGFEQTDKRFEQMQHNMDKRFEQIDKRFEQTDKNFYEVNSSIKSLQTKMFQFMIWSFGFTATVAGIIIAVIKFM